MNRKTKPTALALANAASSLPAEELTPGYYTCVKASGDIATGQLVYLLGVEGDRLLVVSGEHQWYFGNAEFRAHFAFDPDGVAHRAAEMTALMGEISELQQSGMRENDLLRSFNPHVDEAGAEAGMALVPTGGQGAVSAKRSIALMRNQAARLRSDLSVRQQAIKAFAEEQAIILRKQAEELQAILAVAEEAVWTINLYLGQNEEIYRLAEGAPAPADTSITIRQLVLYMDEECAVAAEAGGIDARAIEAFDEWLTADPAHLAQVFPEPKGMVALKPRRKTKRYDDPWMDKAMAEANRKTYFLLRNGENLFRMWTSYEVGDQLIPKTNEFLAFFRERQHNWNTGKDEYVQLKPGSADFMKAEKAAESHKRHYMRAALILQGLIDRTPVFQPLAWKINVSDQVSYDEALQVILDADLMLSDGRERFADWFKRINSELAIGMRVVGSFNSWEHGLRQHEHEKHYGGNERITPRRAGYPDSDQLYTLEEKREGGFAFFFARSGERWVGYEAASYQKRAVCVVYSGDRFILNFDAATVEEMEFYLHSRLDRVDYTYLFPTLKLAIKLKREEEGLEAPFGLLLAGEIVKAHGVDAETAQSAVPELVQWWKFKNRTHRALTADDAKALRMIVAEFGHRAAQEAVRVKKSDVADTVLTTILAAEPNALLVAHKAGAEYVALVPVNDENVFVNEQVWTARGRKETRSWRVVDARHQRWQVLHTSPRWADWKVGAVRAEHLTDTERTDLVEAAWASLRFTKTWRNEPGTPRRVTPLAVAVAADGRLEVFFVDGPGSMPSKKLVSSRIEEPPLGRGEIEWKRNAARVPVLTYLRESHLSTTGSSFDFSRRAKNKVVLPWEERYDGKPYGGKVLWSDRAAVAAFRDKLAATKVLESQAEVLRSKARQAFDSIETQYVERIKAEAYRVFLADFGDPELWEGHLKTLRLVQHLPEPLDILRPIEALVERGIEVVGLSVGEILEQAHKLGVSNKPTVADDLRELRVAAKATKAARS